MRKLRQGKVRATAESHRESHTESPNRMTTKGGPEAFKHLREARNGESCVACVTQETDLAVGKGLLEAVLALSA